VSTSNQTEKRLLTINLEPIGWVENQFNERTAPDIITAQPSRIILRQDLEQGLLGLEIGMQIMVLFHFDRSDGYDLHQHPRGDRTRPKRGVFALRSPNRPNRIGATFVEIIALDGNVITVQGLDAINDTPVIDIKPS
jgi:tRNA (adenine37-N6)-methyltransferase